MESAFSGQRRMLTDRHSITGQDVIQAEVARLQDKARRKAGFSLLTLCWFTGSRTEVTRAEGRAAVHEEVASEELALVWSEAAVRVEPGLEGGGCC